jgi:hypothetical protein
MISLIDGPGSAQQKPTAVVPSPSPGTETSPLASIVGPSGENLTVGGQGVDRFIAAIHAAGPNAFTPEARTIFNSVVDAATVRIGRLIESVGGDGPN